MADAFARRLLRWFDAHGRHDLPWQHPRSAYRVWVSEVMLQQTQVATVIPYFERFIAALPTLAHLAAAPADRVLALWSGLGYYRRAHHLHAAARICVQQHAGKLPRNFAELAALPGIGRSTAGAILALAFDQPQAILDGNAKRVLARFHGIAGWAGETAIEKLLWQHAAAHTPRERTADYTQAIMDLGATLCTRTRPDCARCPQARGCMAHNENLVDAIPAPRPARALPERGVVFIVLRDTAGRVLLQRRPPTGIWPGLWSLPEAVDTAAARAIAMRVAKLGRTQSRELPEVRHTFTHFRLRATPLAWRGVAAQGAIADGDDWRWCDGATLAALGVPAPVAKLLRESANAR